jgi:hypothetical protein
MFGIAPTHMLEQVAITHVDRAVMLIAEDLNGGWIGAVAPYAESECVIER